MFVLETKRRIENEDENDEDDEGSIHGQPPFAFAHVLGP